MARPPNVAVIHNPSAPDFQTCHCTWLPDLSLLATLSASDFCLASFQKFNLEKWAQPLGDLNNQRALWSEYKQWFWDLRPSIWNLANRNHENWSYEAPYGRSTYWRIHRLGAIGYHYLLLLLQIMIIIMINNGNSNTTHTKNYLDRTASLSFWDAAIAPLAECL